MIKLDNQYRINIPQNIREISNVDLEKEVRIYLYEKNTRKYLLLSNNLDLALPCFGKVKFDNKFRFFLYKDLRKYIGITTDTTFLVHTFKGSIFIKVM